MVGSLIHTFRHGCGALGIHFQAPDSRHIVLAIDGPRLAAVEMASVAGKGNQVNHRAAFLWGKLRIMNLRRTGRLLVVFQHPRGVSADMILGRL